MQALAEHCDGVDAVERNPRSPEVLRSLGRAYSAQARHDEAIDIFRTALDVDATDVSSLTELAKASARAGRPEEAREMFQRALEQNVAFVIGSAFHCDGSGHNTARLNFSFPSPERLRTAVQRLAAALRSMIENQPPAEVAVPDAERDFSDQLVADGEHALSHLALNLSISEILQ